MEVYKQIKSDLYRILGLFFILAIILGQFNIATDNTDKDGWNRSGVELITDHGTGLQYLYKNGALIPRVDIRGKHISIKGN